MTLYQLRRHITVSFILLWIWILWMYVLLFGTRPFRSRYPALYGFPSITESSHGITFREEGSRALVSVPFAALMRNRLIICSHSAGFGNWSLDSLLTISTSRQESLILPLLIWSMAGLAPLLRAPLFTCCCLIWYGCSGKLVTWLFFKGSSRTYTASSNKFYSLYIHQCTGLFQKKSTVGILDFLLLKYFPVALWMVHLRTW